jgi:hypothetical protein
MTARDFHGKRAWAEAWARERQPHVGTLTLDGRRITGYRAQGYGDSAKTKRPRVWCVVELWVYISDPGLGTFGGDVAILLEERMPP